MVRMDRMYRLWRDMQLYIYVYCDTLVIFIYYIHLYPLTKFRYTMMVRKMFDVFQNFMDCS